ncbi:TPA: dATP/dGTP pyrophosphohydrolase domain-containing protein [Klebsiella pneumoniae]
MTSKLTREKAQWLHDACEEAAAAGIKLTMNPNELLMFTSYALAAMDSKPVAWRWRRGPDTRWHLASRGDLAGEVEPLYRHAQPAPERDQVRSAHAEWSQTTFGNVGPVGPLKHLSKEALEAAAEPDDLSEWADMQFLLWDAQRRAGITDEQITQAMIEKLAVNKQREWPEPKDGEPRLHIKEQPAPVVTFFRDGIEAAAKWIDKQREAYNSEHGWSDPDTGAFEFGNDAQRGYSSTLEELAEGIRALHPNAGNSPVITDRWIPVSEKLPERGDYLVSDGRDFDVQLFNGEQFIPGFVWEDKITHWMPLPATPQEVK